MPGGREHHGDGPSRLYGTRDCSGMSVGWLPDGSEERLRSAMDVCASELADLPIRLNPRHAASNPLWWSSSAVVDDRFVVKFAWSEIRAVRLWREGLVLERLQTQEPPMALPELVVLSRTRPWS